MILRTSRVTASVTFAWCWLDEAVQFLQNLNVDVMRR
jgi:hypothetical protein